MRLSDAIMAGRVLIDKPDASNYCGCAIGMGLAWINGGEFKEENGVNAYRTAIQKWPFLNDLVAPPKESYVGWLEKTTVEWNISNWFIHISIDGESSLEALCDWIRSVEPNEPTIEETATEFVDEYEHVS